MNRNLLSGMASRDPLSPLSQHHTIRCGLAGDGSTLLATPAQSTRADEQPALS